MWFLSSLVLQYSWQLLIVDEGHRLKNAESKLFGILGTFTFKQRLLLTGKELMGTSIMRMCMICSVHMSEPRTSCATSLCLIIG